MYKYDIPYPNKEQYSLLYSTDGKSWVPINISKNVSYLKTKMKAHRDESVDAGYDDSGYYCIVNPNKEVIYARTFQKGIKGKSSVPYHVEAQKPKINYKKAYVYDRFGDIVVEEKAEVLPATDFDVICNDDGEVLTDLKLLKLLGKFIYYAPTKVIVTKRAQVSIATYLPQTKEEFVKLPGCGEKMYNKCGEMIIKFVNDYLNNKNAL